jgi:hypothetical protein
VPAEGKKRNDKVLILNSDNAVVQASLLEGELATTRLIGEEIASHVASEYFSTLEDHQRFRQEIRSRFGRLLLSTPEYQQLEAKRKQSAAKVVFQNSGQGR